MKPTLFTRKSKSILRNLNFKMDIRNSLWGRGINNNATFDFDDWKLPTPAFVCYMCKDEGQYTQPCRYCLGCGERSPLCVQCRGTGKRKPAIVGPCLPCDGKGRMKVICHFCRRTGQVTILCDCQRQSRRNWHDESKVHEKENSD
jgi:hypothetical protein